MGEFSLTLLGTSSGVPQPDRICSGSVLQCGQELLLIDCGGGVTSAFLRAGFEFGNVSSIIISHAHSDHVCELSLFLQGMYLARREGPVMLYLPDEFVDLFRKYLTGVYLFPERFPFDLKVVGYSGKLDLEQPARISAIANSHLEKYQPYVESSEGENRYQSHSFVIEAGNTKLFYSADIGSAEDVLPHLDGIHLLVTELSHVDQEEFLRAVKDTQVERLVVTHIDGKAEQEEILRVAGELGVRYIEIASDGMRITL
jgi:ribonuclease Z